MRVKLFFLSCEGKIDVLSDTAGKEDDLVDHMYLYLRDGTYSKQCSVSLKQQILPRSKRFKLQNAWRAVLQTVRTLVTMCCMASCTCATLVASYFPGSTSAEKKGPRFINEETIHCMYILLLQRAGVST